MNLSDSWLWLGVLAGHQDNLFLLATAPGLVNGSHSDTHWNIYFCGVVVFCFQWWSWHSLQPKQKRPLSRPSLLLQFGTHSSHSLCFHRLISQFVAICLGTINPLIGHHAIVVFCVCSGKLCVMAAVLSGGTHCSDDSSLRRGMGGKCSCENGKLKQRVVLGQQGSDQSHRAVIDHAIMKRRSKGIVSLFPGQQIGWESRDT